MIKLQSTEGRGGKLVVEMTPFDLVALINDCTTAAIHLKDKKEAHPKEWDILGLEGRLKDAKADLAELERVYADREKLLSPEAQVSTS